MVAAFWYNNCFWFFAFSMPRCSQFPKWTRSYEFTQEVFYLRDYRLMRLLCWGFNLQTNCTSYFFLPTTIPGMPHNSIEIFPHSVFHGEKINMKRLSHLFFWTNKSEILWQPKSPRLTGQKLSNPPGSIYDQCKNNCWEKFKISFHRRNVNFLSLSLSVS